MSGYYLQLLNEDGNVCKSFDFKLCKVTIGRSLSSIIRLSRDPIGALANHNCTIQINDNGVATIVNKYPPHPPSVNGTTIHDCCPLNYEDVIDVAGSQFKYVKSLNAKDLDEKVTLLNKRFFHLPVGTRTPLRNSLATPRKSTPGSSKLRRRAAIAETPKSASKAIPIAKVQHTVEQIPDESTKGAEESQQTPQLRRSKRLSTASVHVDSPASTLTPKRKTVQLQPVEEDRNESVRISKRVSARKSQLIEGEMMEIRGENRDKSQLLIEDQSQSIAEETTERRGEKRKLNVTSELPSKKYRIDSRRLTESSDQQIDDSVSFIDDSNAFSTDTSSFIYQSGSKAPSKPSMSIFESRTSLVSPKSNLIQFSDPGDAPSTSSSATSEDVSSLVPSPVRKQSPVVRESLEKFLGDETTNLSGIGVLYETPQNVSKSRKTSLRRSIMTCTDGVTELHNSASIDDDSDAEIYPISDVSKAQTRDESKQSALLDVDGSEEVLASTSRGNDATNDISGMEDLFKTPNVTSTARKNVSIAHRLSNKSSEDFRDEQSEQELLESAANSSKDATNNSSSIEDLQGPNNENQSEEELFQTSANKTKDATSNISGIEDLSKTPKITTSTKRSLSTARISAAKSSEDRPGRTGERPPSTGNCVHELLQSPVITSSTEYNRRSRARASKRHLTPLNNLSNLMDVKCLIKTAQEPHDDLRDVRGVKRMFKTPRVAKEPRNDLTDVAGVRKLLRTPKTKASPDFVASVNDVRKLYRATPKNDLRNVHGVRTLMRTPRQPRNASTKAVNIKQLFSPGHRPSSPANDLTDVRGLRRLFSPPRDYSPRADYTQVVGVKRMFADAENANTKPEWNVSGVDDLFQHAETTLFPKPIRTYARKSISPRVQEQVTAASGSPKSSVDVAAWVESQVETVRDTKKQTRPRTQRKTRRVKQTVDVAEEIGEEVVAATEDGKGQVIEEAPAEAKPKTRSRRKAITVSAPPTEEPATRTLRSRDKKTVTFAATPKITPKPASKKPTTKSKKAKDLDDVSAEETIEIQSPSPKNKRTRQSKGESVGKREAAKKLEEMDTVEETVEMDSSSPKTKPARGREEESAAPEKKTTRTTRTRNASKMPKSDKNLTKEVVEIEEKETSPKKIKESRKKEAESTNRRVSAIAFRTRNKRN